MQCVHCDAVEYLELAIVVQKQRLGVLPEYTVSCHLPHTVLEASDSDAMSTACVDLDPAMIGPSFPIVGPPVRSSQSPSALP